MASLALKKTTQSQIVRKLSSYKKHPTLKTMIALDEIVMTDYLLDFIDNKEIRTVVRASLCRGESYQQLNVTVILHEALFPLFWVTLEIKET